MLLKFSIVNFHGIMPQLISSFSITSVDQIFIFYYRENVYQNLKFLLQIIIDFYLYFNSIFKMLIEILYNFFATPYYLSRSEYHIIAIFIARVLLTHFCSQVKLKPKTRICLVAPFQCC